MLLYVGCIVWKHGGACRININILRLLHPKPMDWPCPTHTRTQHTHCVAADYSMWLGIEPSNTLIHANKFACTSCALVRIARLVHVHTCDYTTHPCDSQQPYIYIYVYIHRERDSRIAIVSTDSLMLPIGSLKPYQWTEHKANQTCPQVRQLFMIHVFRHLQPWL